MLHIMERWIDAVDFDDHGDEIMEYGWECVEIEDEYVRLIKEC